MEPLSRTTSDNLQSLVVNQSFEVEGKTYAMTLDSVGLTLTNGPELITIPWPALQAFSRCFRETILAYARHKEAVNVQHSGQS